MLNRDIQTSSLPSHFERSEKKGSAEQSEAGSYFERSEKKGSAEQSEAGSYIQLAKELLRAFHLISNYNINSSLLLENIFLKYGKYGH